MWLYILDNCDNTGVWFADFGLASFQLGFAFSESDLIAWLGDKVIKFDDDKFFIPSFVEFQYGELNPSNNAHKPVIKVIEKISKIKPLMRGSLGAQDKEKDKDKDKCIQGECEGDSETIRVDQILDSMPLITKAQLQKKFSSDQLRAGIEQAIAYYANEPASKSWSVSVWGKKAYSWMLETDRRESRGKKVGKKVTDIDLSDIFGKEPA